MRFLADEKTITPPSARPDPPASYPPMTLRFLPVPLLLACCAALAACASVPAAARGPRAAELVDAYTAAVQHYTGGRTRGFVLDPVMLDPHEETRLASEPPDSVSHPREVISRLLAGGTFSGMCEARRAPDTHEPVCPDSTRGMRVMFSAPQRAAADTLEFVVAYATIRRPGDIMRGYGVSFWYRVVRADGVWSVADTRQLSVT